MRVITATELAIQTQGLTKRFGRRTVVGGVDLAVPRGAVFGFLGPNGSGKTTTIRMLLGLASASSGEIRMLGQDMPQAVRDVLPRVGALVEGPAFYPFLSGRANLYRLDTADRYAPARTRRARVESALDRVGLAHAAGKKAGAYSLGMKQRLGIANALLSPRELLVLDEPTNGLDPQGTREVRNLLRSLADEGTTVFISSHLLAEIEQICTHVGVMSGGVLAAQGTLEGFRRGGQTLVRLRTPDVQTARQVISGLGLPIEPASAAGGSQQPDGEAVSGGDPVLEAGLVGGTIEPEAIVAALVAAGVRVRGFTVESASLEDRFVALTGEGFVVDQ